MASYSPPLHFGLPRPETWPDYGPGNKVRRVPTVWPRRAVQVRISTPAPRSRVARAGWIPIFAARRRQRFATRLRRVPSPAPPLACAPNDRITASDTHRRRRCGRITRRACPPVCSARVTRAMRLPGRGREIDVRTFYPCPDKIFTAPFPSPSVLPGPLDV